MPKSNPLGPNLQRRGNRISVFLRVPKDAQALLKKSVYRKSLDTDSPSEAQQRAPFWLAKWRAEIEAARAGRNDTTTDANYWRGLLEQTMAPKDREALLEAITDAARDLADREHGDPLTEPSADEEATATRWHSVASGQLVETDAHLEEWLATLDDTPKTLDQKRAHILKLTEQLPYLTDITRKALQKITSDRVTVDGIAPATVRRDLGSPKGYWRWLQAHDIVPDDRDPFSGIVLPKRKAPARLHFAPADVLRLLEASKADTDLHNIITIAAYTGCRIEEICALTVDHVHIMEGYIEIIAAKTDAGVRQVPIHSKLKPLLVALRGNRTTGFLLEDLKADKYGKRSAAISKRFGRLRDTLGFTKQHVFHSLRRTVVTQLERADVSESITADIVGHKKQTITFGIYGGGSTLEAKIEAIEKLVY